MNSIRAYGALSLVLVGGLLLYMHAFAAEISGVNVVSVTNNSAVVEWATDVNTDATINYGLDANVGLVRYPLFDKTKHSLTLDNLEPATTYHFRVISSDAAGNRAATGAFVFTTRAGDDSLVQRIIKDINKLEDPEDIKEVDEALKEKAGDILKPPTILGATKVVVDTNSAEITWTTDRESGSAVYLVPESGYRAGVDNPYTITQGDANERVTKHSVSVIGLEAATTYHFKVVSQDDTGLAAETADDTFKTRSLLPRISDVKVSRVQEDSAVVSWATPDVIAKGVVEYTNTRTNAKKSVGSPIYASTQSIRLADLELGTRYSAVITATNESGDTLSSDPFTFITIRDVIPPAITKVKNESTLFPGEDTKIQTIVSWETDEPAVCQVFYTQGAAGSGEGDSLPLEPNPLTQHTQVIVGFAPSTVYRFWVECSDEGRNSSISEDFVLITPFKEKNIIDIILENFQGTFGWVNNIGK